MLLRNRIKIRNSYASSGNLCLLLVDTFASQVVNSDTDLKEFKESVEAIGTLRRLQAGEELDHNKLFLIQEGTLEL